MNKLRDLIDFLKGAEPAVSRAVGLATAFYFALVVFANAQVPVLKELLAIVNALVAGLLKIITN